MAALFSNSRATGKAPAAPEVSSCPNCKSYVHQNSLLPNMQRHAIIMDGKLAKWAFFSCAGSTVEMLCTLKSDKVSARGGDCRKNKDIHNASQRNCCATMFWTDRELHLGFQALDFVGLAQIQLGKSSIALSSTVSSDSLSALKELGKLGDLRSRRSFPSPFHGPLLSS